MIVKFDDIATFVAGQSPESKYYSDNEGTPFLQGNRTFGTFYPSIDTYTRKVTKMAHKGDILMSVRAPVGDLNFAPCDLCIGRGLSAINARDGDNAFLFYALKYNINTLLNQSSGTTYDSVNGDVIKQMDMVLPDEKNAYPYISSLLHQIDEKIENNSAICSDLEAIAKLLYDYWFVQFDFPDENGKPYKSSGGKMVWNEELKREIPEGWNVVPVSEVCDIVDCLHSKKPEYCFEDESSYLLSLENLTTEGHIDIANKYYISKDDYDTWTSKIEVKEGDFVVTNAGRAGDIGRIPKGIKCAIGRNLTAIHPTSIDSYYMNMFLHSIYVDMQIASNLDQGSFFKSFNVHAIKKIKVLLPKKDIMDKAILFFSNTIRKVELLQAENQQLAGLRDFLLPMLMNGQVIITKGGDVA